MQPLAFHAFRGYIHAMMFSIGLRLISILLCLTHLFSSTISTAAGYSQTEPAQGFVSIHATRPGLAIIIDDAFVGFTPLEDYPLATGPHTVLVRHPTRANWLDPDWTQEVVVSSNDTVRLDVVLKVSYSITSVPYGAEILSNGQVLGQTPFSMRLDVDELRDIRVHMEGYEEVALNLGSSTQRFFRLALEPESAQIDPRAYQVPVRSRSNTLLYTTSALALASGAVALYFRNRGDSAYEDYRSTGEPALFNKHYDRAKTFDKYAAVSFGVFQISFVTSFYLYLKKKISP